MVGRKTVAGVRGAGGTSSLHPKSQTICLDERNMYIVYHATMSCYVHTVHLDTRNIGFWQMFRDSTKSAHFGKPQTSCLRKISKKLPQTNKIQILCTFFANCKYLCIRIVWFKRNLKDNDEYQFRLKSVGVESPYYATSFILMYDLQTRKQKMLTMDQRTSKKKSI